MSSPVIRSASSAPSRKVSAARSTSTRASRIGLPASSAISRPSSSRRALMPGADLAQDPAALVGGQLAGHLEGGDGRLDRLLVLRLGRVERRAGRRRRVGRVVDDERIGRFDPAAGEEDRMRLGRRRRWPSVGAPFGYGCMVPARPPSDALRRPVTATLVEPTAKALRESARTDRRRSRDRATIRRCRTFARALLVEPGSPRSASRTSTRRHARLRQGDGRPGDRAAARSPRRPAGPLLGRGEALGAGRPPGDRRRRQGRHDQQGHGGVQPAGLPGLRRSRCRAPRSSPTTTCGGSTRQRPRKGEIGIFNRSHYEDVLVVRVHDLVPKTVWSKRYDQINDFERMLADERHDDRQVLPARSIATSSAQRFQARYDDPTKRWKFSIGRPRGAQALGRLPGCVRRRPLEDVDGLGALVRHPGQPQVVPQPRGVDDPRRHPRRPSSRPTRRRPDLPPDLSSSSAGRHRAAGRSRSAGLAAAEERPEDAADDVLPEARGDDLAAGPDGRVDRLLLGRAASPRGLLLGLALALGLVRAFWAASISRCLPGDLALLLGRRHRVQPGRGRRVDAGPHRGVDRRLPRAAASRAVIRS